MILLTFSDNWWNMLLPLFYVSYTNIYPFDVGHSVYAGSWNPWLWKTKTCLSYSQYHGCWWPGDVRSHGINRYCYPSALRAGGVLSSRSGWVGGRAGGCQTCGTHISVTAWWIFSIRSSVELSRPAGVHYHGHMPICPIWACPWAKNLSNLPQIGSRLCGTHISETAGWIHPI